ncbi:HPr family phosphocarrier protein [Mycobacterium sp. MS1601]|uniref:HPr family phosphocarrier protein n=1 Tax=Mycobacterium sp. MS1601 TaxID=1936029 RepID=UPI0009794E3A|nr:HPr family phosphocarrier protein [Mycobacterium sp. MS1601]AQA01617.1 HPr family phosphocarrier protein [Mycobacterium sp. MS1601]
MHSKIVAVGSASGLHARPAALIAGAALKAGVPVTLSVGDGDPVDAGSALMIMTLGLGSGDQVTVRSEDASAVVSVAGLVQKDLDAD